MPPGRRLLPVPERGDPAEDREVHDDDQQGAKVAQSGSAFGLPAPMIAYGIPPTSTTMWSTIRPSARSARLAYRANGPALGSGSSDPLARLVGHGVFPCSETRPAAGPPARRHGAATRDRFDGARLQWPGRETAPESSRPRPTSPRPSPRCAAPAARSTTSSRSPGSTSRSRAAHRRRDRPAAPARRRRSACSPEPFVRPAARRRCSAVTPPASRRDPRQDRLHAPARLAVRRPDRRREPGLRRQPVRTVPVPAAGTLRALLDWLELSDAQAAGRRPVGRHVRARLQLACALVHDPELVFLDEPTAGIDPLVRQSIWRELRRLREAGRTLLITTYIRARPRSATWSR